VVSCWCEPSLSPILAILHDTLKYTVYILVLRSLLPFWPQDLVQVVGGGLKFRDFAIHITGFRLHWCAAVSPWVVVWRVVQLLVAG
jgi:hypothetical protein